MEHPSLHGRGPNHVHRIRAIDPVPVPSRQQVAVTAAVAVALPVEEVRRVVVIGAAEVDEVVAPAEVDEAVVVAAGAVVAVRPRHVASGSEASRSPTVSVDF